MIALHHSGFANAAMIGSIIIAATIGDILIASAMRQIGDLDEIKARSGLSGAIKAVVTNTRFFCGVAAMAVSFFSLLFALSHADLSLVAPASASLTIVTNTLAAKIFLKENVDKRRWIAALCVCAGVILLAH
ncbi:MAG TPA: EamA family transporter [Pseudacidobacterium sp.]|jgi:multidrug transporter EmrE-like cation transporter|nr:EamA family transporter [Pseudacidobacterium sp.]